MNEYKRLTEKSKFGTYIIGDDSPIIQRLGELEDKIEQGLLVDIKSVSKILNEMFDTPCGYSFDGQSVDRYMFDKCEGWCNENCIENIEDNTPCWEMFLKAKLVELRGGE